MKMQMLPRNLYFDCMHDQPRFGGAFLFVLFAVAIMTYRIFGKLKI